MKTFKMDKDEQEAPYYKDTKEWERIECVCGHTEFEVMYTGPWEVSAKCLKCGYIDVIYDG